MAEYRQCEFYLLRYVPDAVKDEFVNLGVVLLETGAGDTAFTDVRFTRDWRRVRCLDPEADVELLESFEGELRRMLQSRAAELINYGGRCRGGIGCCGCWKRGCRARCRLRRRKPC